MNALKIKKTTLGFLLACGVSVFSGTVARADLSSSQARKALTRMPGIELKSGAVRVKSISAGSAATAEVAAEVRTVFKFETDEQGKWRVAELRTGQDRWEDVQLIAAALKFDTSNTDCNAPDPFVRGRIPVDPSVKRARCLLGNLLGVAIPSDAVRVQEVDPMPIPLASRPSATVVAWIKVDARLASDKSGWHVTALRTGSRDWVVLETLTAALNEQKQAQVRSELSLMASALEKFRRDRGSYVISENQGAAIDFLSPRYLGRVIRTDPWHQPYKYQGQRDRFTLRSTGPDGKPDTPDDIQVDGPSK